MVPGSGEERITRREELCTEGADELVVGSIGVRSVDFLVSPSFSVKGNSYEGS